MLDMESVITHLQIIHTWAEFARERDLQFFTPKHLEDISQWTDDALAMLKDDETRIQYLKDHIAMCKEEIERLKEHEAVEPVKQIEQTEWTVCGNCRNHITSKWIVCPYCGRRQKWE